MIARNRIWEELKQAKANIICLQRYTDRARKKLRLIDSSSILKAILPNITQSEQELCELDRLLDFYSKYMNRLERLWYEYNEENILENDMIHKLFEMKEDECDKYSLLNKGIRTISKKEQKKINEESENYINSVYFLKSEEN
jgi:hypothetical protein